MPKYYGNPNLSFPIENIFNISEPLSYECYVASYDTRLSRLDIRVNKKGKTLPNEEKFFLTFNGVSYYEGPMTWNSANFLVRNQMSV